ncbi:MAG: hypothetical protein EXS08_15620 [Planctomycetes bacterium]|nr:hypothetical protein [Planctomycetota bacterium]
MIHSILLSLALATQGTPVHADLHPAEADIYVELGDVSSLLTLLDGAPMLHLLRDARLKPLFDEVGQSPERPLGELVQLGLSMVAPQPKSEAWLGGLKTVSFSLVALGPGSETQPPVGFELVADFTTAEQAAALQSFLLAEAPKHEALSASLPGVELLHFGASTREDAWSVAVGPRVIAGSSATKVDDYVARAAKKGGGLAGHETFQKQLAMLEKPTGAPLLWFALSRPAVEIFKTLQKPGEGQEQLAFLDQIPSDLNPLASPRMARMQMVGERFVTELCGADDGSLSAQKPVDPAWLEPVPKDSMLVYASAFDGASAGKRMRALLAKDEQSAATLAALETKLGFGPERVLARLGPGLTTYVGPLQGLGLPKTFAWLDCEDPPAFTADFEALIKALGETLPGFAIKTKPYKVKKAGTEEKVEIPLTTVTLPPGMNQIPMIQISPSFAAVGKRLVFALNSMDVKEELRRTIGGEGEAIVPGTNMLSSLGFSLPAEARSVIVMDWAKLLGGIVSTVKAFAGMAGPEAMPFDLAKLPPPELFTQYLKPTFHFAKPASGGTYRRNEASFGPETWLGLIGGGALARMRQRQEFASGSSSGEIPPPEKADGGQ